MAKEVKFARPKKPTTDVSPGADTWVNTREAKPDNPTEPMKRLTIDIPSSLHTRVKAGCAMRGVKMADVLRVYLENEFPDEAVKS